MSHVYDVHCLDGLHEGNLIWTELVWLPWRGYKGKDKTKREDNKEE